MTTICGVDGCRTGWVSVSCDLDGSRYSLTVVPTLRALADAIPAPDVIAIDVPIGLPDSGPRDCDVEARRLLGDRASSVFPAPIRPVVLAGIHAEGSAARQAIEGRRVSIQTWAIVPKIREVDQALRADPLLRSRVHEVHPELCFFFMAGRPMQHGKKTPAGREERRALLARVMRPLALRILGEARAPGCGREDVLDALAALWTARRIALRKAVTIPGDPAADRAGLPMQMSA